jgi:hypothetical protein
VQVRALEERGLGEPDNQVIGGAVGVAADARPRQLAQANREVELGIRVVGRPALPARLAPAARVEPATEVEAAAEAVRLRELGGIAARPEAELAELRRR